MTCSEGYCRKSWVVDTDDLNCWFLKPRMRTDSALKHRLAEFLTSQ